MFNKSLRLLVLTSALLFALAAVAHGHVNVYPRATGADSHEKFTLRVPNEKAEATVEVRVEIPEGFAVSRVKPLAGWSYQMEKASDGESASAIIWSGGKIADGEFQEFEFQGKTAAEPGKYAFRAYQTYESGETVEWTGASDAQKPASFMELTAAAGETDSHGAQTAAEPGTSAPAPAPPSAAGTDPAPTSAAGATPPLTTAVAYGGLLLGATALALTLRRR